MKAIIHTYVSQEPLRKVNAFIAESDDGLVVIDTTLLSADALGKKLVGVRNYDW